MPTPPPPARATPSSWILAGAAAAALVAAAAFVPALGFGFLDWDDSGYVVQNERIRTLSAATAWWALTEFHCNYWAPLTWLSFAVDFAVWGLDPFGFHLTNVLLHGANAALVAAVGHRLLSRAWAGASPRRVAAAAALGAVAWAIHPLRVESVVWVAERKDVLSTFFGLLAVLAWLRHTGAEAGPWAGGRGAAVLRRPAYLAALACYALSLLAKAALVTLPFALLVLDAWPLRRLGPERRPLALVEKLPFLALAVPAALVTASAMAPTSRTFAEIAPLDRVIVAFTSLVTYLRLTAWPADVSPVYFHPNAVPFGPAAAGAVLLVLALSAGVALAARRGHPAAAAAWAFFLISVLPVLGLTQNGKQELAPRFTYVPSVGLALLAGAAAVGLAGRLAARSRAAGWAAAAAVGALCAALVAVTVRDTGHWRDDVTMWSRVLELDPRFGLSFELRADALAAEGRHQEALRDLDRALEIALARRWTGVALLHVKRARALEALGRREEARAARVSAASARPPP